MYHVHTQNQNVFIFSCCFLWIGINVLVCIRISMNTESFVEEETYEYYINKYISVYIAQEQHAVRMFSIQASLVVML